MNSIFDIPPLPTQDDYLEAVVRIDERFRRIGSAQEGLLSYVDTSREVQEFTINAVGLSRIIEPLPIDEEPSLESSYLKSKASVMGALAGLLICLEVKNPINKPADLLSEIKVNKLLDDLSKQDVTLLLQAELNRFAEEGIENLGEEFFERVEKWETTIAHELEKQFMFRRNMAMVAYAGYCIHESLRITFSEEMTMHDWDGKLRKFNTDRDNGI